MKFKMSPNIAVRTPNYSAAKDFYTKVLGFNDRSTDPNLGDLDADPLNMFIIEDSDEQGVVMELFVEDLDEAKNYLVANGCEIIRWLGKGQDCYVRDPFGVLYNIWEMPMDGE
jgi:catechol 2,3-dioxygenase-like lactoylglutathione lyase family enzyme